MFAWCFVLPVQCAGYLSICSSVIGLLLTVVVPLCAPYDSRRNEVDVPEDLKKKLEASVHEVIAKRTDFLVEMEAERRSSIEKDETVMLLTEMKKKLKPRTPHFSLRVKNGSYTITNYYDEDGGPGDSPHEGEGDGAPRRAKQKIPTVKTESPVFKLRNLLCKLLKGQLKRRKEEVVIMDQVNLAFEPGKMYLVLYVVWTEEDPCISSV